MKKQYCCLLVCLCGIISLPGWSKDGFLPDMDLSGALDWISMQSLDVDTVPKVEINGRLKVNDMPEGSGMQVVTDANGNLFKSMMMPPSGGHDSLTYTIVSGFGPVFPPGTYPLVSFQVAGTASEFAGSGVVSNFSKLRDAPTVGFVYLTALQPANTIEIEVKVYESGASTPYYSYKLKNITILAFSGGIMAGGAGQVEDYTIQAQIFGVKDQVTGGSFAFDSVSEMQVPY